MGGEHQRRSSVARHRPGVRRIHPEGVCTLDGWVTIPKPDDLARCRRRSRTPRAHLRGRRAALLVADTDRSEGVSVEIFWARRTDSRCACALVGDAAIGRDGHDGSVSTLCVEPTTARIGVVSRGAEAWGALRALAICGGCASAASTCRSTPSIGTTSLCTMARCGAACQHPERARVPASGPARTRSSLMSDELRLPAMVLSVRHGRITGLRYGTSQRPRSLRQTSTKPMLLLTPSGEMVDQRLCPQRPPCGGRDTRQRKLRLVEATWVIRARRGRDDRMRRAPSRPVVPRPVDGAPAG